VSGLLSEGRVQLVWDTSEAPDFKTYRVYRGIEPSSAKLLGETPTPSFTDEAPPSDPVFYYQVSGVDQLGNEGPRSDPARVERR
jgi:fibronectin type 3 domain-containing protein